MNVEVIFLFKNVFSIFNDGRYRGLLEEIKETQSSLIDQYGTYSKKYSSRTNNISETYNHQESIGCDGLFDEN